MHNRNLKAVHKEFQTTLDGPASDTTNRVWGGYRPKPGFRLVPRDGVSYRISYATREATARRKELRAKVPHVSTFILRGKRE